MISSCSFVLASSLAAAGLAAGGWTPQELLPDFFAESVATFKNPHTNADCLGFENPAYCCTGPGTGTCHQPVESFVVSNCTTRNRDCTGNGTPFACCTGFGTGSCCYEEGDGANLGIGNSYCPASVCPDGCVSRWIEQSGHRSEVGLSPPLTGRALEQDDLEKPCFKRNCLNGHPCIVGHPAWTEPGYPSTLQPKQDATFEIEPPDRTGTLAARANCPGPIYLAQLVRIVAQSENHRLLAGSTKYLVDENVIQFRPFNDTKNVSIPNVLPALGEWYFLELSRDASFVLTLWVDGVDVTSSPAPISTSDRPWINQVFCEQKDCPSADNQEFRGEGALYFYRCGPPLTASEQRSMRLYVDQVFFNRLLNDGFESGDTSRWSARMP